MSCISGTSRWSRAYDTNAMPLCPYHCGRYEPLVEGVRAATEAGIKASGVDARLGEIGGAIQEVMESHEIELDGKVFQVKSIKNLNGHSIEPYRYVWVGATLSCWCAGALLCGAKVNTFRDRAVVLSICVCARVCVCVCVWWWWWGGSWPPHPPPFF